jgi:hypothetical protein
MAYAVSVWFDEDIDREIRGVGRVMADEGISRFLHNGPFRPHLTLAIHDMLSPLGSGPIPYYLPERWNTHCTIACGIPIPEIPRSVSVLLREFGEQEARIRCLALIETPAEQEIGFWDFQSEMIAGGNEC